MHQQTPTDRFFAKCIAQYAEEHGFTHTSYSHEWIHRLTKDGKYRVLIGSDLGLNSSAVFQLCRDKAATSALLEENRVACIKHYIVFAPGTAHALSNAKTAVHAARIFAECNADVVAKPNTGGAGRDVYRCTDLEKLHLVCTMLFKKYRTIAISPFVKANAEYRITVLDGAVIHAYKKVPAPDEFRLNLAHGARVVDSVETEMQRICPLAIQSALCIGARFVNVDVLLTDERPLVVEINGTVSFEKYAAITPEYAAHAYSVYTSALNALFV